MLISKIPFDKVREAAIANNDNNDPLLRAAFTWGFSKQGRMFWSSVDEGDWDKAREIDKELGLGLFDEAQTSCGHAMDQACNDLCSIDQDNGTTYKGYESATAYHQAQIDKQKSERFKPLGDENSLFQWPGMRKER